MHERLIHLRAKVTSVVLYLTMAAGTAVSQVAVEVETVDGQSLTAALAQITPDQVILRSDDTSRSVARQRVLRLKILADSQRDTGTPGLSESPWLMTSTGDWLRAEPMLVDDESLVARWSLLPGQPPLTVPLEFCVGAILELPRDPYRQGILFAELFDERRTTDHVVLRNGDRIDGEFVSLRDGQLRLGGTLGETAAASGTVQILAFNPELMSFPEPDETHAAVLLTDGSVLRLKRLSAGDDVLLARSIADAEFEIPLKLIDEICFRGNDRVELSSLPIEETELNPYLSVARPPRINRSVLGTPLRVQQQTVASGIGVASGTSVTVQLDRRFRSLVGRVALDDAAGSLGSVRFEILGDDRSVWRSPVMTADTGPVELPRVDVSETVRLTLRVDVADRASVRDVADWCDLVLLK